MNNDKTVAQRLVLTDANFHISGKGNSYYLCVCGVSKNHATLDHHRGSLKVDVRCAMPLPVLLCREIMPGYPAELVNASAYRT
jgi:hypothetical protein